MRDVGKRNDAVPQDPFSSAFHSHDHQTCITKSIEGLEAACAAKGARLTPIRRQVFEILLEHHRAMGAYEILEKLTEDGKRPQPPVAYRALEFLVGQGCVHKIESLNAYIACEHMGTDHQPAFLICRSCQAVAEGLTEGPQSGLHSSAQSAGFLIETSVIEAEGLCPNCQDKV